VSDPPLALAALALSALREASLCRERGADLRAARGDGAVVGRPAALLDQVPGVPLGLERLVARTGSRARDPVGLVARGVGGLHACAGALDLRQRRLLGARGLPDLGDERLAPVALREDTVLAAGRHLPELARAGRPDAPVAGHGDAAERGIERLEVVDDPDAREQRGGEPRG
jgi:hypothetical protein